jgi:hypothetical protein
MVDLKQLRQAGKTAFRIGGNRRTELQECRGW